MKNSPTRSKTCIWCRKEEGEVSFITQAHTIPKSLGGNNICTNVCDACNRYFGSYQETLPPIETVLKEAFAVTRARFLAPTSGIGKNKPLARFKSTYFKVDFDKRRIELKPTFKLQKHFQQTLSRQLKRGLYKVFLEEIERQRGEGWNEKYDFIREFSRYNLGDYPLFYFERRHGAFMMPTNWISSPEVFLAEDVQYKYLINAPGFFEFDLLGHTFGIATTRHWKLLVESYLKESISAKENLFRSFKIIERFDDIDLLLSIMNR